MYAIQKTPCEVSVVTSENKTAITKCYFQLQLLLIYSKEMPKITDFYNKSKNFISIAIDLELFISNK